jgi:cytochrome b561
MKKPAQYHPILVVTHWVVAALVFLMLVVGLFYMKYLPNTNAKIPILAVHMVIGIALILLSIVRLVVRFSTKLPAQAKSGNGFLDMVANVTHMLLYMGVLAMGLSGMGAASQAGLMDIVFGRSGNPLPPNLYIFPARIGHGYVALGLLALIGLHLAGAAYHQFVRKDHLLARMTLRKHQPQGEKDEPHA